MLLLTLSERLSFWRDAFSPSSNDSTQVSLGDKMNKELKIISMDSPPWDIIGGGISDFNTQKAGDDEGRNMCFILQTPQGEVVGGVIGATNWDWLYINLMWIREDLRGKGFGTQLITRAEKEAKKRGSKFAYLDTFSFQAPDFYKKHGYQVFGELDNFPTGHKRYFLRKEL